MDNNPTPEASDYHVHSYRGLVGAVMTMAGASSHGPSLQGHAPSAPAPVPISTMVSKELPTPPTMGPTCISLSWGGSIPIPTTGRHQRMRWRRVVGRGGRRESGSSSPHYPAGYAGVLSVAMTDPNGCQGLRVQLRGLGASLRSGLDILSLIPCPRLKTTVMEPLRELRCQPLGPRCGALVNPIIRPGAPADFAQIVSTADDISAKNPLTPAFVGSGRAMLSSPGRKRRRGIVLQKLDVSEIIGGQ